MFFPTLLHSNSALELKVSKNALNSCNFSCGNINCITIIRLYIYCVIRVAVLKLFITQLLFYPIFSNFHILYNPICTFIPYFTQIMHLRLKYRKTHSNSCNFRRGNINYIRTLSVLP